MEPPKVDFGFAFNNAVFSDCVLRIEVIENSLDSKGGHTPNRKSRGKDLDKENENSLDPKGDSVSISKSKGKDLNKENADSVDSKGDCVPIGKSEGKDLDKETEKNPLDPKGDCIPIRESKGEDSDKENVVEVKTLHVNSLILAEKILSFRKLFEREMNESQQREVTLKISASEDAPLMEVLKFMYSDTLSSTSPDLLAMLRVADKLEFTYGKSYCSLSLQEKAMSLESALSYLELPESVKVDKEVQPLINAEKAFILEHYSDFNKSREQVMDFPLCAVEVVLSSARLHVDSEDDVVDFILEWASGHYPKLEERREILTKHLLPCICLSCLSPLKLNEVLMLVGVVFNANHNSLGRIYKLRHIKVVQLEFSPPRCVVYFELKREECTKLSESSPLDSRPFCLGGRWFYLSARVSKENTFGLFLNMTKESKSCTLDYEYTWINKPGEEFKNKFKGVFEFKHSKPGPTSISRGDSNLFMSIDSEYFVDGMLHLRADLSIKIKFKARK